MNDFKTATEAAGIRYTHTFENRPKKEDYYRHNHSDYELYICFSGDMDFVVEDRMYELPPYCSYGRSPIIMRACTLFRSHITA